MAKCAARRAYSDLTTEADSSLEAGAALSIQIRDRAASTALKPLQSAICYCRQQWPAAARMGDSRVGRPRLHDYVVGWESGVLNYSGVHVVKLTLRDKESAQEAVRRFRKLVERSGIKKEMRVREFYEKPSEIKRRARLRAERRSRRERFLASH